MLDAGLGRGLEIFFESVSWEQGDATTKPGLSHPPHLGVFNGGGAPGAARLLPWPTSRRDLPKYPC